MSRKELSLLCNKKLTALVEELKSSDPKAPGSI
jgi:hypothetical protein